MTHPVLAEISTQQVVMGQTELHSLISGFYYIFFFLCVWYTENLV